MHCILFAANKLNIPPISFSQVGNEVVLFPGSSTRRLVCRMLSHRRWPCLPHPHRCSPHIRVTACLLHCRTLSPSMHAAQLPSSIVISHQHRAIMCNDASAINHSHVHVYMHMTKQDHRHFFCKSAMHNASKLNTSWCHVYAVNITFSFSKIIMMFGAFHYIQILEILWSSISLIHKIYHLLFQL